MDIRDLIKQYDEFSKDHSVDERAQWLKDAAAKMQEEQPGDLLGVSALYNELGSLYRHADRFRDAEEAFLQALKLMETPIEVEGSGCTSCYMTAMLPDDVYGTYYTTQEKTSNYATIVNNLAGNYRMMQRFDDAIELYNRAWEIYRQNPETPVEITNSCMNNLALVYMDLRKTDEAKRCFRTILKPMEDWAPGSYELATTYGNLAFAEALSHNKEEALENVLKAEAIFAEICEKDDPTYQGLLQLKSTIEKM